MNTKKIRQQVRNADGGYDILHPESEAELILTEDGGTVQQSLDRMGEGISSLEAALGDLDAILDEINGEVV